MSQFGTHSESEIPNPLFTLDPFLTSSLFPAILASLVSSECSEVVGLGIGGIGWVGGGVGGALPTEFLSRAEEFREEGAAFLELTLGYLGMSFEESFCFSTVPACLKADAAESFVFEEATLWEKEELEEWPLGWDCWLILSYEWASGSLYISSKEYSLEGGGGRRGKRRERMRCFKKKKLKISSASPLVHSSCVWELEIGTELSTSST